MSHDNMPRDIFDALPANEQKRLQEIDYHRAMRVYSAQQLHNAFVMELLMSLANLYVASEATGFVGTWTSNWCTVIAKLARSRGDGGYEYFGVDRGSFFTECF